MNDNSNSDDLPKHLKSIRQQLGLSQEELAQKLGVSFTSVNRWENGQTKPSKTCKTTNRNSMQKTELPNANICKKGII